MFVRHNYGDGLTVSRVRSEPNLNLCFLEGPVYLFCRFATNLKTSEAEINKGLRLERCDAGGPNFVIGTIGIN